MDSDNAINCNEHKALITLLDNEFDYATTLQSYMAKMKAVLDDTVLRKAHWTQDRVSRIISEIIKRKKLYQVTFNLPLKVFESELDVAKMNGESILVFANTCVQILSYEDCFDVLVDLHRRMNHAGVDKMAEELHKHYFIIKTYIYLFLESCNSCVKYKNMKDRYLSRFKNKKIVKKKRMILAMYKQLVPDPILDISDSMFNDTVKIAFLSMVLKPDGEFNHILIYHDIATQYTLLRPLVDIENVEIAMEIFRIITDFGPPKTIESSEVRLLEEVIKIVQMTPVEFNCTIVSKCVENERNFVENSMNEWMKKTLSSNWATGCYVVQSYINISGNERPIEKLFGDKALKTVSAPKFDLNRLWNTIADKFKDSKDNGEAQSESKDTDEDVESQDNEEKLQSNDLDDDDYDDDDIIILSEEKKEIVTSLPSTSTAKDTLNIDTTVKSHNDSNFANCFKCNRSIYFDAYKCIACKKDYHIFCAFKSYTEIVNVSPAILCYVCQVSYEQNKNNLQ